MSIAIIIYLKYEGATSYFIGAKVNLYTSNPVCTLRIFCIIAVAQFGKRTE